MSIPSPNIVYYLLYFSSDNRITYVEPQYTHIIRTIAGMVYRYCIQYCILYSIVDYHVTFYVPGNSCDLSHNPTTRDDRWHQHVSVALYVWYEQYYLPHQHRRHRRITHHPDVIPPDIMYTWRSSGPSMHSGYPHQTCVASTSPPSSLT